MIKLRKADIKDIKSLLQLNKESLGYENISLHDIEERFTKIQKLSDHLIIVASVNDTIAGYIHFQEYDTLFMPTYVEVLALCVLQEFQKDGIGTSLIKYVEAVAFEQGIEYIRLGSSLKREGAHRFYERLGYHVEKTHKIFHKKLKKIEHCQNHK